MARFSVDPKSYELAEHFLADVEGATEEQKRELAQQIQDVCEDFIGCDAETFAALTA
jgi:phenylpyruvate tautomerase PptA (4-oxalocrotonate tautomerase family)